MNPRGCARLGIALLVAQLAATGAAAAFDFGSFKTDTETDQWLRENSATYAGLVADIERRTDIRGYRFVAQEEVRRGMVAWFDGYLEIQLNPQLAREDRVTAIIFEMANASRYRDHQQIDLAVDQGLIRTPEEFGLAHEMIEYEALRLHRQILLEIAARAGPLPTGFFYFVTPAPRSIEDYQLPDLHQYLKSQKESGHTSHYYKLFPLRASAREVRTKPPTAAAIPRKILIDTDPGGDDVFALLWLQSLARQGQAEIIAVTTVAGNVDGQQTFANASRVLALLGCGQIEVGRSTALRTPPAGATHIHGADGIGDLSAALPPAGRALNAARFAPDLIIERLNAAPGQITLVAVGPLTNLAAAEEKCPGILAKAKEVVVMGGAFKFRGNITPQAEFNIHYDPEAAARVFASRDDIVVLPLDVTNRITFTEEHAELIRTAAPDNAIARLVVALSRFLTQTTMQYRDTDGLPGFHVHDGATVAYLFYPETILLRRAQVRVETQGQWTRGQTVFDDRHQAKTEANAWVALQVDAKNLLAILVEDLRKLCTSGS